MMRHVFLSASILVASAANARGQAGADWPVYGGDAAGTKYSTLTQIHLNNVQELVPVWEWSPSEEPIPGPRSPVPTHYVRPASFEGTPVALHGELYLSTSYNRVVALDGDTGAPRWIYDPRIIEWGQVPNGTGFVHRGVGFWREGEESRVFLNSRWRLISIDGVTGEPVSGFGHRGEIDLTEHLMWSTNRLHYTQTSPPVIYKDLVILGNGVWDLFVYERDPPGNIQAFDIRTGELAWSFNLIPQEGELGTDTWEDEAWRRTGHTNVWAPFTLDEERGLLYLPVGTASNDFYGGHRKGDNLFAETLLCLDAETGERVWHFQAVHHGMWDYDLSSPPTLLTIEVDDKTIDAVAAPTKMGFVYVFDRVTGEPVWPIEERPVPPSDVPGERASKTQPFPSKPAPVSSQGFDEEDLVDFTPELRAEAKALVSNYRMGALFTPPSLEGTIVYPGFVGGSNWGGAAADLETGVLYVKASNMPTLMRIKKADPNRTEGDYEIDVESLSLTVANGIPINKPPYGTLTAIDLNTGEHAWQSVVGDAPVVRNHPALEGVELPDRLGSVGATGPIVTAGGLVFISGGSNSLHAFDKKTGDEVWSADLGSRSNANPMTFLSASGRQLVVIATGAGAGAKLIAFGLPAPEAGDERSSYLRSANGWDRRRSKD